MAFNQYVGNHKQWDHVGTITPDFEISEGIRPAEEFKPAAWIPVQRYDKFYEEYFVISAGKIVALDSDGRVVPAQYGVGAATVTYTQEDVDEGTTDLSTGNACDATSISGSPHTVSTYTAVSKPIGVAQYNFWQWAGGDGIDPSQYRKHNHNLQHQVSVLCDYYIEMPLVPAVQAAEALDTAVQVGSLNVYTFAAMANVPMAVQTDRTPLTFAEGAGAPGDVATRFQNEVATLAGIIGAGDYFVDYTTSVVSVYATSGPGDTDYTMAYYHYASAPAGVSSYACAVGVLAPGDFVMADANSNYLVWDGTNYEDVVGQVLARDTGYPKDALDRVRTAYQGLGVENQMPGSANGGVPHNISYSGAANTVVRINLINR